MVERFSGPGDDVLYQDWLSAHPEGYVVNIGSSEASGYARLHRATCTTIKTLSGRGTTFVDQWVKLCSTSEKELNERVAASRGSPAAGLPGYSEPQNHPANRSGADHGILSTSTTNPYRPQSLTCGFADPS
jgi:hypothetical protein